MSMGRLPVAVKSKPRIKCSAPPNYGKACWHMVRIAELCNRVTAQFKKIKHLTKLTEFQKYKLERQASTLRDMNKKAQERNIEIAALSKYMSMHATVTPTPQFEGNDDNESTETTQA